jgi:hypothetical protein
MCVQSTLWFVSCRCTSKSRFGFGYSRVSRWSRSPVCWTWGCRPSFLCLLSKGSCLQVRSRIVWFCQLCHRHLPKVHVDAGSMLSPWLLPSALWTCRLGWLLSVLTRWTVCYRFLPMPATRSPETISDHTLPACARSASRGTTKDSWDHARESACLSIQRKVMIKRSKECQLDWDVLLETRWV